MPPTKAVDLGSSNVFNKMPNPSNPNTIDGTAARLLIFISIKSVNLFLLENSSRYIAPKRPNGNDKSNTIIIVKNDPINDPPRPANSASLESHLEKNGKLNSNFTLFWPTSSS